MHADVADVVGGLAIDRRGEWLLPPPTAEEEAAEAAAAEAKEVAAEEEALSDDGFVDGLGQPEAPAEEQEEGDESDDEEAFEIKTPQRPAGGGLAARSAAARAAAEARAITSRLLPTHGSFAELLASGGGALDTPGMDDLASFMGSWDGTPGGEEGGRGSRRPSRSSTPPKRAPTYAADGDGVLRSLGASEAPTPPRPAAAPAPRPPPSPLRALRRRARRHWRR